MTADAPITEWLQRGAAGDAAALEAAWNALYEQLKQESKEQGLPLPYEPPLRKPAGGDPLKPD
jgi:hypothetical protein